MDNDYKKNDTNNECMNIQYNENNNIIEKSSIEYKEISFNEKTFLPLNNKTYFILPNFNKRSPKVIYYYRDKNFVEIKEFHTSSSYKIDLEKIRTKQIKPSLDGLIFDQPTSHKRNSKSSIDIKINVNVNDNKLNNDIKKTVTEEIKPDDIKIDITKNNILTTEINHKESIINNSNMSLLKNQKEVKDIGEGVKENQEEKEKENEPNKEDKTGEINLEKENSIKQYQTQVNNENDKYVNYQFYYIEKAETLVKFHSCNYTQTNENITSSTNYNKRKNIKKKDIILPKTINRKSLKRIIKKIGNGHIKMHNY
jgi:hypothetical protein